MLISLTELKRLSPLIHCITNPISINQCANAILAVGARPIMAEHPREVGEITASADAVMLNLGNITDVRMQSMAVSAKTAIQNNIPMVLDAVGTACSKMRLDHALELIKNSCPTVIKGNYSEITALLKADHRSSGVDAVASLSVEEVIRSSIELAARYNCVILSSGKVDIITDGRKLVSVKNGTPRLSSVTGTGCMLGALCGCFLALKPDIQAAVTACAVLGISGQLSDSVKGTGSFMVELLDNISTLTDSETAKYLDIEVKEIEEL